MGAFIEADLAAGVLDVLFTPGVMKKNRPGGQLQVVCRLKDTDLVQESFFRHSLTLGIRKTLTQRVTLKREASTLKTPLGELDAKRFHLGKDSFEKPEFEALKALAIKTGRSVAELKFLLADKSESG
mgnify:CR=1 FL=1